MSLPRTGHPGMQIIFSWKQLKPNKLRKSFLPLPFPLTDIQTGKPASGRELEHIHFSMYE